MLFLPAAALCCLCSALVAMAAELIQGDLTLTRRVGEKVSFSCEGTDRCDGSYIFWYQKKDTETFTRILNIKRSDGKIYSGYNHPQKDDFSAVNKQNGCELEIQKVKLSHSATYYCSCGKDDLHRYGHLIFGSGTKLYVTDEPVVEPVVSVYPAASRAHQEGKSSLLCLASAMFPPLVRFSWRRRKENGPQEVLPPAEGEQLELRESRCTAAIRVIDLDALSTYKYRCSVQHEGGTVEAQIVEAQTEQGQHKGGTVEAQTVVAQTEQGQHKRGTVEAQTVVAQTEQGQHEGGTVEAPTEQVVPAAAASLQSQCRVKLLCVLYTVLIVKSLVYCCGLSLLRILRNKGPSTDCTHAD
ncbi:immunoglobulin lambda-1 light chain-like [Enoplosus armatus]|uniref:immunoglobulin lambda-1 light chain-like n=1 Tax=Enoplosus armatus TaxID=215367 RepID=UPI00399338AF